jgi:hypothetical protein
MCCTITRHKLWKRDNQLRLRFEECTAGASQLETSKVLGTKRDILVRWARSITAAMSSFEATLEPPAQRGKMMSKKYADSSGLCYALCSCRGFSIASAVTIGGHGVIDLQINHPVQSDRRP